jgi:hypothetical protein
MCPSADMDSKEKRNVSSLIWNQIMVVQAVRILVAIPTELFECSEIGDIMQEMKLAEYLSCIVRINAQEILV